MERSATAGQAVELYSENQLKHERVTAYTGQNGSSVPSVNTLYVLSYMYLRSSSLRYSHVPSSASTRSQAVSQFCGGIYFFLPIFST